MAATAGKIVVISALSGTFEQKPFNSVLDLVPKCEKIKQLHAICKICYGIAPYSLRIAKHDAGDELIGSHDMYMPVCRECFVFKTKQMQDRIAQANVLREI
jgi:thymidine kinase